MTNNPTFNLKLRSAEEKKEEGLQKQWIIVAAIALLINFLVLGPKLSSWVSTNGENSDLKKEITQLESSHEELTELKKKLELEKKEKAGDDLEKEDKIFPAYIDTFRIANVLEVIALQLENIDINRDAKFSLEGIRFSGAEDMGSIVANKANISVQGDAESIKEFLNFIKNGEIPEKVIQGEAAKIVSTKIMNTLQTELLPVATVERVQISTGRKDDILKTTLLVHFYSRES